MSFITIRPEHFTTRLRAEDYSIYRDGFCLLIKTERGRQGFVLSDLQLYNLIRSFNYPLTDGFVQAILVGDPLLWTIPTDEKIIQYCIDQALIPHPYEEYGF